MIASMMRTGAIALTILVLGCGGGGNNDKPDARRIVDATPADAPPGSDASSPMLPETLPTPLPSGPVTGSFVSYNAGLIQVVKGGAERLPLIISALKALDADVICLEEVWPVYTNGPNMAAALADVYPYAFWTWTGTYQLRNGLLIVSKHPLYRGREIRYTMGNDGPTLDRMAIGAVAVADDWHLNVVCTHFHAGLQGGDPEIRLSEAQELESWAATEGLADDPSLLLGDFNSGPVPPSWQNTCECNDNGEADAGACNNCVAPDLGTRNELQNTWTDCWPEDADFFTSSRPQYLALAVVPGLFPDEPTQRIDHCMYKGLGTSAFVSGSSGTVLTADPNLDIGTETLHYLSDHYGIRCTFSP